MAEQKNIYLIRFTYTDGDVNEIFTRPMTKAEFYEHWEKPMLAREFPFYIECRYKEYTDEKDVWDREWITEFIIDHCVRRIEDGVYHARSKK
jgi:hypothetical protein